MELARTLVFIDGGYLSKISRHLGNGRYLKIDLLAFSAHLAKEQGLVCEHMFYYTAPPFQGTYPSLEEIRRKAGYDSFTSKLRKMTTLTIREGRLQKINNVFTQKGVDTLLTIDIIQEPIIRGIRTIILLAADTDFVPVLNQIRSKNGIRVILYYYTDWQRRSIFSLSNYLLTACDKKVILKLNDFQSDT